MLWTGRALFASGGEDSLLKSFGRLTQPPRQNLVLILLGGIVPATTIDRLDTVAGRLQTPDLSRSERQRLARALLQQEQGQSVSRPGSLR